VPLWSLYRLNRLKLLGIGLTVNWLTTFLFDWVLYPLVILYLGIISGGVLMTFLTAVICYAIIVFYDKLQKDWLCLELVKEYRVRAENYRGESRILTFLSRWLRRSDLALIFALSLKFDPAIVTIATRRGKYSGMGRREWYVFTFCVLFGNLYWIFLVATGISIFRFTWNQVTSLV
jgi:hypothetical protein